MEYMKRARNKLPQAFNQVTFPLFLFKCRENLPETYIHVYTHTHYIPYTHYIPEKETFFNLGHFSGGSVDHLWEIC